ncbi:unnamed protein product [Durusdinium trenchii]
MSLPIVDSVASVSEVNFTDLDLDAGDLGGALVWTLPSSDFELVDSYLLYFATGIDGSGRSLLGTVGPERGFLTLPVDTPLQGFTHLLVYTKSSLVEQTTPVGTVIYDLGVSASNLSFPDFDLDATDLGGNLTWAEPEELDLVKSYKVYFGVAQDESNTSDSAMDFADRQLLGEVSVGITELVIPPETPLENFTHILIYLTSSLAEQTTPASLPILDVAASASQVNFTDEDLDESELGGNITWSEPHDHYGRLLFYRVYFQSGASRETLDEVLQGTTEVAIPAETPQSGFSHVAIYTVSALIEQTTPSMLLIEDTVARVSNLSFEDLDLDDKELGGNLTWLEPIDMTQVTSYAVYFALSANESTCAGDGPLFARQSALVQSFCRGSFFAAADAGDLLMEVPPETATGGFSHFLVYASSALAEQSTPAFLQIDDRRAIASSVSFDDFDLDLGELGGTLSWVPAFDVHLITMFNVYLATDAFGADREMKLSSSSSSVAIVPDTPLRSFTHLLIYAASSLVEQSTPGALLLADTSATAENLSLPDFDLDEKDLGGTLAWDEPLDTTKVTHYVVYFVNANNSNESDTRAYFDNVSVGIDTLTIPTDTALTGYGGLVVSTHVAIYTLSTLVEQTTPAMLEIVNAIASVSGTSFVDKDLDASDLGGRITWQNPADISKVIAYNIYLAEGMDGTNRSHSGSSAGANFLDIIPDTPLESFSHILVYTQSSLVEQTTPNTFLLSDAASTVDNVSFPDEDLDRGDLGGILEWSPPLDISQVTHYMVYFGKSIDSLDDPATCVTEYLVNVTNDTVLVAVISGSLSFQLDGATVSQVEEAVRQTLSMSLGVSVGSLTVWVQSGRRLMERLLAASWSVTYQVVVPAASASSVVMVASGFSSDLTSFATQLAPQLVSAGVSSSAVSASLVVLQFLEVSVEVVSSDVVQSLLTTTTSTPVRNNSNATDDSEAVIEDSDESSQNSSRRLSSISVPGSLSISQGWCRELIMMNLLGDDTVTVAPDTALGNYTHFLVYTASSLVEQSTPYALEVFDEFASVSNMSFVDLDLDLGELGGNISWSEPLLVRRVQDYLIYLAEDAQGLGRSQVDLVPQGQTLTLLPPETAMMNFSFVLIYARSALAEQTTPSYLALVDEAPVVFNISLEDLDLDANDLGGTISWETSDDRLVRDYVFYFAQPATASCADVQAVAHVAVVIGSMSFGLEGVDPWQVDSVIHSALAAALNLGTDQVFVRRRETGRRLEESRWLPIWNLEFQVLLPPSEIPDDFDSELTRRLQSLDSALVASATALTITTEQVQKVPLEMADLHPSGRRLMSTSSPSLCRSFLKMVQAPGSDYQLPAETPLENYTHLLVYLRSSLVEQSTPFAHLIVDVFASVSQISFVDLDLDLEQFGGTISWSEPVDTAAVQSYQIYFNNSNGRRHINTFSPGTSDFALPADTAYEGGDLLIYTESSLAEQTTPVSLGLSDTLAAIGNASFPDFDLDAYDLGGQLVWDPPQGDLSKVTHYMIYMARYFTGENDTESCDDGTAVELAASIRGSMSFQLPGSSAQVEAAVRATLLSAFPGLSESALIVSVSQLTSRRLTTRGRRLSTIWHVSYQATMPLTEVAAATSTAASFSEDATVFATLLKPQLLAAGISSAVLDTSFTVLSFSRLSMEIVDSAYLAEHFAVLMAGANQSDTSDADEDSSDAGNQTRRLLDEIEIQRTGRRMDYIASIFSVSLSWCRRFAGTTTAGTTAMTVPPETVLGNYTHYLIYAASSLAEQSFPFALLIEDTDASVSSIHFDGQDLDFYDLGGELSWLAPNDTERVDAYLAYLASGASGLGRSQLGEALPPEVLKLHVPANTPRGNFTHFTVFTRSVLVEQTTPAFLAIQDEASRANNVSFVDDDLDEGEIGGNLTWLAPEDFSEVVDYVIYIAEDRFGANRSLLGNVSFDTFSFLVPENTPLLDHSHLLIYARSTLEEQSTPASVVIIETVASVSNITFVDLDLDAGELGGRITFKAPASERVVSYVTYLATWRFWWREEDGSSMLLSWS